MIGMASDYSFTQKFNCHKLSTENVGVPQDLKFKNLTRVIKKLLKDQPKLENVSKIKETLNDERANRKNLNQWIEVAL